MDKSRNLRRLITGIAVMVLASMLLGVHVFAAGTSGESGGTDISSKGGLIPEGIVQIVPDTIQNALVVKGTKDAVEKLGATISRLDVRPTQIMIHVDYHWVPAGNADRPGIEWTKPNAKDSPKGESDVLIGYADTKTLPGIREVLLETRGRLIDGSVPVTSNNVPAHHEVILPGKHGEADQHFQVTVTPRLNCAGNSITLEIQSPHIGPGTIISRVCSGETAIIRPKPVDGKVLLIFIRPRIMPVRRQIQVKMELLQLPLQEADELIPDWKVDDSTGVVFGHAPGTSIARLKSALSPIKARLVNSPVLVPLDGLQATTTTGTPSDFEATVTPRINQADNSITLQLNSTMTDGKDLMMRVMNGETFAIKDRQKEGSKDAVVLLVTPRILPERALPAEVGVGR